MTLRLLTAAAALAALAIEAQAAPSPPALPPATVTPLEGVDVTVSKTAPEVVGTFPKDGASVPAGLLVVKITLDQPMVDNGGAYAFSASAGPKPDCLSKAELLRGDKVFVLLCKTFPGATYTLSLNPESAAGGFVGTGGRRLAPYQLHFSTQDGEPTRTLADAQKLAGLGADQGPIKVVESR